MGTFDIYHDMMTRTGGDIYIGVVGPVRTGKSTFIKRFAEKVVLPCIEDESRRMRVIDELPQSGDGRTIMTTEPKFVPDGGVRVSFGDGLSANVRLIDSVGYIVDSAEGYREGDTDRYVTTPWSDEKMTFKDAGEYGTKKVIVDHSTIGIVMTTDGSIGDIPREAYIDSEARVIGDVKALGKPFVVVVNSVSPTSKKCQHLVDEMREGYGVNVVAMDVASMTKQDAESLLREVLMEFPIRGIEIDLPNYLSGIDRDSDIVKNVTTYIGDRMSHVVKMSDYTIGSDIEDDHPYIDNITLVDVDFGTGIITYSLQPRESLFYEVISTESGVDIRSDSDLVSYIKRLKVAEDVYTEIGDALEEVTAREYSIVMPRMEHVSLSEPTIVKKGTKCSVHMQATAPSLHIMKVDVSTDICPLMGTEEQCNEMVEYINNESETGDKMSVTLFNKPLSKIVDEAIEDRMREVTDDTRAKMVKTMTRIVNEGKGGVLCILI